MFMTSKKRIALIYTEYKIQLLNFVSRDTTKSSIIEQELPKDVIRDGLVVDEVAFFEIVKKIVKEHKLKGQQVIFAIPENAVTMRSVEHPPDLRGESIKEHFEMEVGNTLHLPFEEPIIDLYDADDTDGQATLYATNGAEVMKVQQLLADAGLKPYVADIKSLANLRIVEQFYPNLEKAITMVLSVALNEFSLSIYSNREVGFIRFHSIETDIENWQLIEQEDEFVYEYKGDIDQYKTNLIDAFAEINRIMNFYRFSINKENQSIEQIMLIGDNPELGYIQNMLMSQFEMPIFMIKDEQVQEAYPNLYARNAEIIGFALHDELLTNIPKINLLPAFKMKKTNRTFIWLTVALSVACIVALALWNASVAGKVNTLTQENEQKQQAVETAKQQLETHQAEKENSLDKSVTIMESLAYPVTPVIEAVNKKLKDYEYKTKLTFSEKDLSIEVQYETFSDIANYIEQLQTNKLFTDIKVATIDVGTPNKEDYSVSVDDPVLRHTAVIDLTLNLALLQEAKTNEENE
ncbi:MAG: pilus assembly protein PilM [Kurthia sp.]|nr:pilus assembly protein PilM [Candidatus Kurthia equi]